MERHTNAKEDVDNETKYDEVDDDADDTVVDADIAEALDNSVGLDNDNNDDIVDDDIVETQEDVVDADDIGEVEHCADEADYKESADIEAQTDGSYRSHAAEQFAG